jgi:glycosyltransferase involved in cell wall biosynthesis
MSVTLLEVVLPAHNEGATIAGTLREWAHELRELPFRIIVSEDGSTDDTVSVVRTVAGSLPVTLISEPRRKGYSRAVIDALASTTAPYVLCVDADGQCDPADVWALWELRDRYDIVKGRRVHRADPLLRRVLSSLFRAYHGAIFRTRLKDPSCPYVLMRRAVVERLVAELGELDQGFWWEVMARAVRRGYRIGELAVRHRPRTHGATQVYRLNKMPRIGVSHALGLLRIWWQTRA